jgi:ABC-type sugar transport system substrate-binding protein
MRDLPRMTGIAKIHQEPQLAPEMTVANANPNGRRGSARIYLISQFAGGKVLSMLGEAGGNVVEILGTSGAPSVLERSAGFRDAIEGQSTVGVTGREAQTESESFWTR